MCMEKTAGHPAFLHSQIKIETMPAPSAGIIAAHSCVHAGKKGASCLGATAKRQHGHVLFQGPGAGVSRSLISVGPLSHRMTEQLEPCGTETILLSCLLSSLLHSHPLTSFSSSARSSLSRQFAGEQRLLLASQPASAVFLYAA